MGDRVIGQVKWFGTSGDAAGVDRRKSYGFLNVIAGPLKDTDVFVHQSAIKPCFSTFRTLRRGEFVEFDIVDTGDGRKHAACVTGIHGYPMMCDMAHLSQISRQRHEQTEPEA